MGFKREDIRDTSPLSLKKLNDTLRYLWLHDFGNIDFADLSESTQGIINNKVGNTTFTQEIDTINQTLVNKVSNSEFGTKIQQSASDVKIAVGQIGGNNLLKNSSFEFDENITKSGSFTADFIIPNPSDGYPVSIDGGRCLRIFTSGGDSYIIKDSTPMKLEPNKKYTISFDYACSGNYANSCYLFADGIPVNIPLNIVGDYNWHRFSWTFTLNRAGTETFLTTLRFGFNPTATAWFLIDRIKIEEGENATAWAPHASEIKTTIGEFTDDHFRVSYQDGSYTEMNSQGFKWHNGATSKDYHYLIETGRCITIGDDVSSVWVQLPDEFKGKTFKVTAHVEDSYNGGNTTRAIQKFNTYITGYDYPNGRVAILGYRNEIDVNTGVITRDALGINWTAIV